MRHQPEPVIRGDQLVPNSKIPAERFSLPLEHHPNVAGAKTFDHTLEAEGFHLADRQIIGDVIVIAFVGTKYMSGQFKP